MAKPKRLSVQRMQDEHKDLEWFGMNPYVNYGVMFLYCLFFVLQGRRRRLPVRVCLNESVPFMAAFSFLYIQGRAPSSRRRKRKGMGCYATRE